jgi:Zn-finger nucleic acid-binding protein
MVQAYEADALAMADRAAQSAARATDTSVTGIPCAGCDTPMQVRRIYEVDVDVCSQHGTWFDAHELRKVADAMALARRQQFQQGQARPSGAAGQQRSRPPHGGNANVAGDDTAFVVGYVAADSLELGVDAADVGLDALDVGAGAVDVAGDVAGAVAEGGVDILGGAFEIVGAILGGLLEF